MVDILLRIRAETSQVKSTEFLKARCLSVKTASNVYDGIDWKIEVLVSFSRPGATNMLLFASVPASQGNRA